MNTTAARDRSYRAQRVLPAGSTATFTEDIKVNIPSNNFETWTPHTIPAGAPVQVWTYTNAGFRGIEVSVIHDGTAVHGISAGLLDF